MKRVVFIRHGSVIGNELKQYIGKTDQPLSEKGVKEAMELKEYYDSPAGKYHRRSGNIYVSSKIRCTQTADILFPDEQKIVIPELCECNFGIFEGKSFDLLQSNTQYQIWINSGCKWGIPEGEKIDDFIERCTNAFLRCMDEVEDGGNATFVVHGGTVMAIFSSLLNPKRTFFDTVVDNCTEIKCDFDGKELRLVEECETFFQNKECKRFPCHKIDDVEHFNCMFCYCPLYSLGDKCGGDFKIMASGRKNCENCTKVHEKDNYDEIVKLIPR